MQQAATTTSTDATGREKRQEAARRASVIVDLEQVVGAAKAAGNGGGAHEGGGASSSPEEVDGARVRVLPLVRGDHRGRVLLRPLHPLLHPAPRRRAPVVAPWVCAVLDGLLAVLAPAVAVLEVVDLALGHERHTGLPRLLLASPFLILLAAPEM